MGRCSMIFPLNLIVFTGLCLMVVILTCVSSDIALGEAGRLEGAGVEEASSMALL